jgi:hypothetical protein
VNNDHLFKEAAIVSNLISLTRIKDNHEAYCERKLSARLLATYFRRAALFLYCNKFAGFYIHDGSLLHSEFNIQLLITVHSFSIVLTQV